MSDFFSCCFILMEIFSSLLFFGSMLQKRKWTWVMTASVQVCWILIFLYTNFCDFPLPTVYFSAIIYLTLSFICYNDSWLRHCIVDIMGVLLLAIIDTLVVYLGVYLLGINIDELYAQKNLYLTLVPISKGFALLISWIFWRVRALKTRPPLRIRWLFLTLLFPIISLVMLVAMFENFQNGDDVSIQALVFTLAILFGNATIMYLIYQLEKAEIEMLQNALLTQQMEIQTQSVIALEKSYQLQRKSAHEFNHHLQTINSLLSSGNYKPATQYIDHLCNQKTVRVFCINSHNPIIDAILNLKFQLAADQGIEMRIKVNDLANIPIPTDSLVVLLSNLLDNAIEASSRCESQKIIRFSMILDNTIFLTIDNTSMPVLIIDGEIETTKKNKHEHGYGLINIRRILNMLSAEFAFQYNDGWFSFVAEIPCK